MDSYEHLRPISAEIGLLNIGFEGTSSANEAMPFSIEGMTSPIDGMSFPNEAISASIEGITSAIDAKTFRIEAINISNEGIPLLIDTVTLSFVLIHGFFFQVQVVF